MRIGFYAQGEGPHLHIAKHLIESARRLMPGVGLYLLTDGETSIEGVEAIRIPEDMPMGVRRVTHYSQLEGDWVFLDTDVVFRKDVRHVFQQAFDVALASREGTYMHGTKYAEIMPYNFGVVFSRCPKFWEVLLKHLKTLPAEMKEWGGEQRIMCEMAKAKGSPFDVRILPSAYNFTPHKEDDDMSHACVVHMKGPRKAWLPSLFPLQDLS